MKSIANIAIDQLKPAPFNHRDPKSYGKKPLADLASSIKALGILSPIIARLTDGHYQIVAGHRRHAAALLAGLTEVPVTVMNINEAEAVEICAIENLQREDLSLIDEAAQIAALHGKGNTIADIAKRIGKSNYFVATRLAIHSNLLPALAKKLDGEGMLADVAKVELMARLSKADQNEIATTWSDWHFERAAVKSTKDFAKQLDETFHRAVADMPWPTAEVFVIPAIGSCDVCPLRSSKQVDLFGDYKGKDVCLDGACYLRKKKAWFDIATSAFKAKNPNGVVVNSGDDDVEGVATVDTYDSGVSGRYTTRDAKTSKEAVTAIDIATGKIIKVIPCGKPTKKAKAEGKKAETTKADKEAFLHKRSLFAAAEIIREQSLDKKKGDFMVKWPQDYGYAELATVIHVVNPRWVGADQTHIAMPAKAYTNAAEICSDILENGYADIVNHVRFRDVGSADEAKLTAFCKFWKLDYGLLMAEATLKIPTPKSLMGKGA